MVHLPSSLHYYLYRLPCDMRKGPDKLCGLIREQMNKNPLSEAIFIFVSRSGSHIRLLHWEGDGFGVYSKRLQEGVFELPPVHTRENSITVTSDEVMMMLRGIVLRSLRKHKRYRHPVDNFVNEKLISSTV